MSLTSALTSGFQRVAAEFKTRAAALAVSLAAKANLAGSTSQPFSASTLTATGQTSLGGTAGAETLRVLPVTSAVNWIAAAGAPAGLDVIMGADGVSATVPFTIASKGAAQINFKTNGTVTQAVIGNVVGAVNYLHLKGGTGTTLLPTLGVVGADAAIDLVLKCKGVGTVKVDGAFQTNGTERSTGIEVVSTANVAAITLTARTTIINSTGSATIAFTFPTAAAAIHGQLHTITSVNARNISYSGFSGASGINGFPATISASTPFTMMFDSGTNSWHRV